VAASSAFARETEAGRSTPTKAGRASATITSPSASDQVTIASHGKQPLERRRQTQRDLDIVGVDKRRETPARVSAVRGRQRTPKAAWEGDLHASRHTKWLARDRNPLARIPVARRSLKASASRPQRSSFASGPLRYTEFVTERRKP